MIYQNQSFAGQQPLFFQNGDEIINCNCVQLQPHTPFAVGISGLKFSGCNLVNCDLPEDAQVDMTNCMISQVKQSIDENGNIIFEEVA